MADPGGGLESSFAGCGNLLKNFVFSSSITCWFWLALVTGSPALAWGPQGHRVAGELAESLLDNETRAAVRRIIGEESLASASTWADRMRDNPSAFWQEQAGPYHYVTVPAGKRYCESAAPAKGDAVTALTEFERTLEDRKAPLSQRRLALRFSLHIVQDLHQPLHVGNGTDRGGNDFKVTVAGKGSNLHRVWDSEIMASAGLSDPAWVERLNHGRDAESLTLPTLPCSADPQQWIARSAALRDRIYPASHRLDEGYFQRHVVDVENQLRRAALATACWLTVNLGHGVPNRPAVPPCNASQAVKSVNSADTLGRPIAVYLARRQHGASAVMLTDRGQP